MQIDRLNQARKEYGLPPVSGDVDEFWEKELQPITGSFRILFEGFDEEPDLETALRSYSREIEAAKAAATQGPPDSFPWSPPPDFMPEGTLEDRTSAWRSEERFPALAAARGWVVAISMRVLDVVPPVSLAEFDQLAGWFRRNKARAYLWVNRHKAELGFVPLGDIELAIRKGGRCHLAGQAAQLMRQLKKGIERIR